MDESQQVDQPSRLAYSPLDTGQIRLLRLDPAVAKTDPIRCIFQAVPLASAPAYEALSYAWGDRVIFPGSVVVVDGVDVRVTRNLLLALISLRRRDAPRTLWVDALCINQDDVEERGKQVSMMGRIYQEAESVAVFLGEEWDGVDVACEYLELAAEHGDLHFVPSLEPHVEVRGMNVSTPLVRDSIIRFFSSMWFYRVWTVQEFVLAKRLTFQYGTIILDGQHLQDGYRNLRKHASDVCCGISEFIIHQSPEFNTNLFFALSCMDTPIDLRIWPESRGFLDALHGYRQRQCSDPRDRIYGTLGMSFSDQSTQLRPDYTKPVEKLFSQLAQEQIEQTHTLDILSHVIRGEKPSLSLPSYVPDWTVEMSQVSLLRYGGRQTGLTLYNAAAGTLADFQWMSDSRAVAKGILVDHIEEAGMVCHFMNLEDVATIKAIVDEARALAKLPNRPPDSFQVASSHEMAFWSVLCGNLSVTFQDGARKFKTAEPSVDYESYLRWTCLIEEHMDHNIGIPSADVEVFGNALLPNISGRRFARTRSGLMSVVDAESQPGDLVVVLAGGKVPYVLREQGDATTDDSRAVYTFIGDSYVDGLMNGEAIGDASRWTSFDLV